ncbi:MAG: ABC transporter permease [Phototrophicaceae bacterium]|jgi:NitT/TauT family transport system permease protein
MSATESPARQAGILKALRYYTPTILVAVLVVVFWEVTLTISNVQQFLLPKPSVILGELWKEISIAFTSSFSSSLLLTASAATLWEAVGGFVIGCGAGVLVALITARWTIVSEAAMPFAIAANSVPIIALAPIMNNWFGITNPASKMAIVAIIVFFPVMINTVRGLTQVDPMQLELMHSYAASPFTVLFDLRIPNALPYIFSALRVASSLSVIGAVVGEFFGGPRARLGTLITQEAGGFNFAGAWAAIVMASVIGIAFYLLVLLAERRLMPWYTSLRQTS